MRRVPQKPLEQAGALPRSGNELEVARIMASASTGPGTGPPATTRLAAALIGLLAIGGAIYFATNKVGVFIDLVSTHLPTTTLWPHSLEHSW